MCPQNITSGVGGDTKAVLIDYESHKESLNVQTEFEVLKLRKKSSAHQYSLTHAQNALACLQRDYTQIIQSTSLQSS